MKTILIIVLLLGAVANSDAVTARFPTGVNVNANGTSTVVINYFNLAPGERAVDAFWCGDVTQEGIVANTNPCVPGTFLGRLSNQLDISSTFGLQTNDPETDNAFFADNFNIGIPAQNNINANNTLQDVMSIPLAVVRRAYQEAQNQQSSEFFYIRQFVVNGVSTYVTVTCRMAGGGARTPLSLTNVDLHYLQHDATKGVPVVTESESLSPFQAHIHYTGSGILRGRWEVVMPGQEYPSAFDLLPEGSVPITQRGEQRRYRLISRFNTFLPPTGNAVIEGPNIDSLPFNQGGQYLVLFRVEASDDKESNIVTEQGIIDAGGAAGFAMPVLRYFVTGDAVKSRTIISAFELPLKLPLDHHVTSKKQVRFSWHPVKPLTNVAGYRIDFFDGTTKQLVHTAIMSNEQLQYKLDSAKFRGKHNKLFWRISGIAKSGDVILVSKARRLTLL